MSRKLGSIQAFASLFMFFVVAANFSVAAAASVHTVTIEGMKFTPASLVMKKGDTVQWVNKDIVPHTATEAKKRFDSGVLQSDGTWKYTASAAGKFDYVCTFHPMMKGTITVQ